MEVRRGTIKDVKGIMRILERAVPMMNANGNFQWDGTYPNETVFENDIDNDHLWVIEVDDGIAGFAAITTDQEPEYKEVGWDISQTAIVTHRLAVDPKYRGMGIAKKLLEKAEDIAIENNIQYLRIDTNTNNPATQQLFPKCGYTFCGEIGLHFRPGLRFYCYEKILR